MLWRVYGDCWAPLGDTWVLWGCRGLLAAHRGIEDAGFHRGGGEEEGGAEHS